MALTVRELSVLRDLFSPDLNLALTRDDELFDLVLLTKRWAAAGSINDCMWEKYVKVNWLQAVLEVTK